MILYRRRNLFVCSSSSGIPQIKHTLVGRHRGYKYEAPLFFQHEHNRYIYI